MILPADILQALSPGHPLYPREILARLGRKPSSSAYHELHYVIAHELRGQVYRRLDHTGRPTFTLKPAAY